MNKPANVADSIDQRRPEESSSSCLQHKCTCEGDHSNSPSPCECRKKNEAMKYSYHRINDARDQLSRFYQ